MKMIILVKVMGKKREHLVSVTKKDFEIQWFHGSGAGGQHRNKHANYSGQLISK